MLHEDGASTANTGTLLVSIAMIGSLKGSRTSPEKLKPAQREFGTGSQNFGDNTEDGVHNVICSLQRSIKVLGERHVQIFQLRSQTLVEVIVALLGIKDSRLVSVVPEMASGNQSITAYNL